MGMILIEQGALQLALNALRRDADAGMHVRAEIADELARACKPLPEPVAWWDATEPSGLRWADGFTRGSFDDGAPVIVLPSNFMLSGTSAG